MTVVPTPPSRGETAIKVALDLVPWVGQALAVIYEDTQARRKARVETMANEAIARYPDGYDGFVQRLTDDQRLAEHFVRLAESAARSSMEEKAIAFGMLLADTAAAANEDEFDRLELLGFALADLESPHIRALHRLSQYPSDDDLIGELGSVQSLNDSDARKDRLRFTQSLPAPVTSTLLSHGLVEQKSDYGLFIAGLTGFGRQLLAYIREAAEKRQGSTA
jgi:hypothetical protein